MVRDQRIEEYLEAIASSKPAPGGGGASAIAGAFGASLSLMVISLTVGKKKYRAAEEQLKAAGEKLQELKETFYRLADEDEEVFLPLSKAYGMKKDTEEEKRIRDEVMEKALLDATEVPMKLMRTAFAALEETRTVAELGSLLVLSDAGVAGEYLRTALTGASLNVFINLRTMKDERLAASFREEAEELLERGKELAEKIGETVSERLGGH